MFNNFHKFWQSEKTVRARLKSCGFPDEDVEGKLESFRELITATRELLRMSVGQLADGVGISPATLSAFEQGADISESTFDKLCSRLGLILTIDSVADLRWGSNAEHYPWNVELLDLDPSWN